MIILGIRTDSPVTVLNLKNKAGTVVDLSVETGRELGLRLLEILDGFLKDHGESLGSLEGLVCFAGPGSFTGLRIGHTVMNTLAYSLDIPITQKSGDSWFVEGCAALESGTNDRLVLPEYGAEANITKPK